MDFNFDDLKKEAAATAENVFKSQADHNLSSGSSTGVASDNAHTEDYFANEQKEADYEHVDPQTFVQRMSAGAKEAQEQLDAKFTQQQQHAEDFLTEATRDLNNFGQQLKQNMGAATQDFMNMERNMFGDFAEIKNAAVPEAKQTTTNAVQEQNLLGDSFTFNNSSPPLEPYKEGEDLMGTFSKDSDTDTPSVSYNPSPAKKPHTVADALKEQDNEQFISSEDLLSDFKDDFKKAGRDVSKTVTSAANLLEAATAHVPTTDLDADDENEFKFASEAKAAAAVPATPPATPVLLPSAVAPPVVKAVVQEPVIPAATPKPTPPQTQKKTPVVEKSQTQNDNDKQNLLFVEEIFFKYGLDAWFKPERLHPVVESLIYWRDVKKSGIVFGAGLITLLAISCFSVISVFAYLSLFTLVGTIAYRSYKSVMQAIQKTSDGHPFKDYLELDLTMSQEKVQNIAGVVVAHVNGFVAELRRLFLVEDLVDSIKFGLLLWVLTYIGALFNGMTLVILAFVSLFTLPKVYENNKQSIDTYLELVRSKLAELTEKIKAAIPIGKKPIAAESDKDK